MRQRAAERALHFPAHLGGVRRRACGKREAANQADREGGLEKVSCFHVGVPPRIWLNARLARFPREAHSNYLNISQLTSHGPKAISRLLCSQANTARPEADSGSAGGEIPEVIRPLERNRIGRVRRAAPASPVNPLARSKSGRIHAVCRIVCGDSILPRFGPGGPLALLPRSGRRYIRLAATGE